MGMPVWPATLTAFALELADIVPQLSVEVHQQLTDDQATAALAQRLAHAPFIHEITFSKADDPRLDAPTVLWLSDESWEQIQSDFGEVPPGERERGSTVWHTAFPLASGGYLLAPDSLRPGTIAYYRATRNEEAAAFDFRAGTVSDAAYEVVWKDSDDRCHLRRYFNGHLECIVANCPDVCHGGIEIDPKTGARSFPCGCP
jgi:hypothetical protein